MRWLDAFLALLAEHKSRCPEILDFRLGRCVRDRGHPGGHFSREAALRKSGWNWVAYPDER